MQSARLLQHTTFDILEGIIEAIYTKDRGRILERINLCMEKLRVLFRIAYKRRCLAESKGLPIGNLTSQFFANVYLDPLDHFVKDAL